MRLGVQRFGASCGFALPPRLSKFLSDASPFGGSPLAKNMYLERPLLAFPGVPPGRLSSPDSTSTRSLLQNRGVESSGRSLQAEIWPSLSPSVLLQPTRSLPRPLPGHLPAISQPLPGQFDLHLLCFPSHWPLPGHFPATSRPWRFWRPPLGQVPKPLEGPRRVSLLHFLQGGSRMNLGSASAAPFQGFGAPRAHHRRAPHREGQPWWW